MSYHGIRERSECSDVEGKGKSQQMIKMPLEYEIGSQKWHKWCGIILRSMHY